MSCWSARTPACSGLPPPDQVQKGLITIGIVILVIGLLWPVISKLGLGRLPGDILIRREGFTFYFPLATSIIVSVVVSLIIWWFRR